MAGISDSSPRLSSRLGKAVGWRRVQLETAQGAPIRPAGRGTTLARGAALGATWAGLSAAVSAVAASGQPLWGSLLSAGTGLPWAGPTLGAVRGWTLQTLLRPFRPRRPPASLPP
jgi:hypothetical protein